MTQAGGNGHSLLTLFPVMPRRASVRGQGAGLEQTGAARGPLCAGLPEGTESLEFVNAPAGANFKVSAARGNGVEVSIRQAGAQRMPVRYWPKPSRREWRRQLHQRSVQLLPEGTRD